MVDQSELIVLGRIGGAHGVKGWVRVQSFTDPRDNILSYPRWLLGQRGQWVPMELSDGRKQGKSVVALLDGIDDRNAAEAIRGCDIAIPLDELPPLPEGEYYWADLVGLRVRTADGRELGLVHDLMQTGANDVLVVRGERERLIPMVMGQYVTRVDLDAGVMDVDWDPDF